MSNLQKNQFLRYSYFIIFCCCFIYIILAASAHAIVIILPDGSSFDLKDNPFELKSGPYGFSQMTSSGQKEGMQCKVSLKGQQGYISFGKGKGQVSRGTLHIIAIADGDENSQSKPISVRFCKDDCMQLYTPDEGIATRMADDINRHVAGCIGVDTSLRAKADISPETNREVITVEDKHVMWVTFRNVEHQVINFQSPSLVIGREVHIFDHKSHAPAMMDTGAVLILYYIPDDDIPASTMAIHVISPATARGTSDLSRAPNPIELTGLSQIVTLDNIIKIARLAGIDDPTIISIKSSISSSQEQTYQLLSSMAETIPCFTLQSLVDLMTNASLPTLAERVVQGRFELSSEDMDLQVEMASIAFMLDPEASSVAIKLGLNPADQEVISKDSSPGFQLLRHAYMRNKLGIFYSVCCKAHLSDFQRQVEEGDYPLLAAFLRPGRDEKAPVEIKPSQLIQVDLSAISGNSAVWNTQVETLAWINLTRHHEKADIRAFGNHVARMFGKGRELPRDVSDHFIPSVLPEIVFEKTPEHGTGLTYGKLLCSMNTMGSLRWISTGRQIADAITAGDIYWSDGKLMETLAFQHLKSNPKKAFTLVSKMTGVSRHTAHKMGFQCQGCSESGNDDCSRTPKYCRNLPTLSQMFQRLDIRKKGGY